ncbi:MULTISPECIES: hypothetical protein [Gordonibacter]|uniref:Uncharacterized protein n=1 Tax=Gordonibacter faecis TaxID=3047475 RepID=A0ABT7DQ29_9ACTN|nr:MULTISPECIES: hypothetical protein [unclassified Gordonibacter]MDJ1651638.1 hypothetical protein [Gordonibacter sp. KGMB12511]HIW77060.1 hypothetical protein [Candidatus Gordonibacter avicola]
MNAYEFIDAYVGHWVDAGGTIYGNSLDDVYRSAVALHNELFPPVAEHVEFGFVEQVPNEVEERAWG